MNRFLLSISFVTLFLSMTIAQSQFENASFEDWEEIEYGSIPEPVEWSSVRTATPDELAKLAPAVWDRSDDAHSGNHSLYLINIDIFGITATGTMTNGRILANLQTELANSHTEPEEPKWNTPLTKRPDSLIGWYKCKPTENDFPTAKALLHTGYASLPQDDSSTWIGVAYIELSGTDVNEWTRFSTPFEYFNNEIPEFMLSILTAGNGLSAIGGSEAWFDDVELIYLGTSVDELNADALTVYSSNGRLYVHLADNQNMNAQISVIDLAGNRVFAGNLKTGNRQQFDLNVKDGIYIVNVRVRERLYTKKVYIR